MTFLSLLAGPLLLTIVQWKKKLGPWPRICNFCLTFLLAYVIDYTLFPIKALADQLDMVYLAWIYGAICSLAAFVIIFFAIKKEWKMKEWMILLVLLWAVLFFSSLFYEPLISQELLGVSIAQRPFDQLIKASWQKGLNPPLYFVLLKCWISLFGTSPFALRLFGLIPYLILLAISYWWFSKNNRASLPLFMALIFFMPLSIKYASFTWSYMLCALFSLCGCYLLMDLLKEEKPSTAKQTGMLVCFLLASWSHFAALPACIIGLATWSYVCIRYKKGKLYLALDLIYLLSLGLQGFLVYQSLAINTAYRSVGLGNLFMIFVSGFSAWEGNAFLELLILADYIALFFYLAKARKEKGQAFWFVLLLIAFPLVFYGTGYLWATLISWWRSFTLANRNFIPFDFVLWFGLALLLWKAFESKKIMQIVLIGFLVMASYSNNGWINDQWYMTSDTNKGVNYLRDYAGYGYEFVFCNYRGNIGWDDENVELIYNYYGPKSLTDELEGENIKNLDYKTHKYFILSNHQLTKGLKTVMKRKGADWNPLGSIHLAGLRFFVYTFNPI